MDMDITLDVNVARLAHAEWELELERLASGGSGANLPHIHARCDLGRWVFGRGLRKYGNFTEMWKLKETHGEFHMVSDEVIRLKAEGSEERVLEKLKPLRKLSREIVYLLTGLELAVLLKKQKAPLWSRAGKLFTQLVSGEAATQPFSMILQEAPKSWFAFRQKNLSRLATMLDVNAARLNHVMMVHNLEASFNRLSRGNHLLNADECGLGLWMEAMDHSELHNDPKFETLDSTHRAFHDLSKKTLGALHRQDYRGADKDYQLVIGLSRDIVFQLTHLELTLQDSKTLDRRMKSIL